MNTTINFNGNEYTVEYTIEKDKHGFSQVTVQPFIEEIPEAFTFSINLEGNIIQSAASRGNPIIIHATTELAESLNLGAEGKC